MIKNIGITLLLLCSSVFAQSGNGTLSGYLATVNPDGAFHRFTATYTDGTTFNITNLRAYVGTAAVDDGSGTCGTNLRVEGQRGFGYSVSYFIPAGVSGVYATFELMPSFSVNGDVFLSVQQVGSCVSPAGDINLTAKYTY